MNYHIVYNNFKDYAEIFIKNIDFSKANINKVLFLHIGDEEAISEIIENTNFKNAEFYIKDEDSLYDIIETSYSEKVHKFLEYNNMEFDLIIANPPYGSLGNPIISEAITHLTDNGTASVLMPLSCYKKKELYRHVETFELANPKLFKDAVITENLCICTLNKREINKYSWEELQFASFDTRYSLFYKWNMDNNKGLKPTHKTYSDMTTYNIDMDFIETSRAFSSASGAGFGKGGFGYEYNVNFTRVGNLADLLFINFPTKTAKINFSKYWYNNKKGEALASKAILGIHSVHSGVHYYFAIPQIDWNEISDKYPDYEKDPDYYVLKEMGLKWDDKKEKIIKE